MNQPTSPTKEAALEYDIRNRLNKVTSHVVRKDGFWFFTVNGQRLKVTNKVALTILNDLEKKGK